MTITDELREWMGVVLTDDDPAHAIADRIDAEHQKAEDEWKAKDGQTWLRGYMECHAQLMEGNWVIAADLDKAGWVRGPLDADGEIWHSGDMSDSNWGVIEGIAYEDGTWYIKGHDISAPWIPADSVRHHHPPTVEDVLEQFVARWMDTHHDDIPALKAEYAAKLRLAGDDE